MGAAALGLFAGYTFWRWLRSPSSLTAAVAAVGLALAELSKLTWLVLFPLWPVLWVLYSWDRLCWKHFRQLVGIFVLAVGGLNLGYGFEGTFTQLGDYQFVTRALGGKEDGKIGNRFSDSWLGTVPIPLPKNYVAGIDRQKLDFELRRPSYLRGEWKKGGWWYYYLYAAAIKVPLGTWLLGSLAVGMTFSEVWRPSRRRHRSRLSAISVCGPVGHAANTPHASHLPKGAGCRVMWRDEVVLLAPAVAVFVLVSSQTGFNHHMRYVLPTFPFVFICISKVGRVFERTKDALTPALSRPAFGRCPERGIPWRRWLLRGVVTGALSWSVLSSLFVYPHSLSYFNELVGGPKGGHWHLGSSNVDWGQDLLYLKDWYEEHPEAQPLHLAYDLPLVDPKIVGIKYENVQPGPVMNRPGTVKTHNWPWGDVPTDPHLPLPDASADLKQLGPLPGWYCLSVNLIHRVAGHYEYFLEFEPVDWIGYSMMVFHITVDEANRVRRKLGLPLLSAE
jgi:hypothetical protein